MDAQILRLGGPLEAVSSGNVSQTSWRIVLGDDEQEACIASPLRAKRALCLFAAKEAQEEAEIKRRRVVLMK